jgi:tetratricopeptide (TPR) repeat protein
MREENYEEAAEQFAIVRDKFEGYEDWYSLALLGLGQAYEELEKFEEAREVYNALDALRPEDDFGKTAKSRLNRIKDK